MPDFVDNTAGYSEVTGTADYLMTATGTGLHLRLDQALVDAQEVAYYAVGTSNGVDAFESGVATWDDSENTLVVGTITNSSNGGGKISWDAGDKTIYIVANSATMVNTADERLVRADVGDFDASTELDGTELIALDQGGVAVSGTTEQILGDPVRQQRSHGLNYLRDFTDFHRTRPTFSATDGALIDLEPWVARINGSGAAVLTGKFLGVNGLILATGTTTTGYAVIEHTMAPFLFAPANNMTAVFRGGLSAILPSVEAFTVQIGFRDGGAALATVGLYFQASAGSLNWRAVTNTGSGISNVDTGIPITIDATKRFKIVRDAVLDVTRFYIDETLVHTSTPGRVDALSPLKMMATIHKSAGTTLAGIGIYEHSYAVQTTALVGF
jgi:hypothetical protein